MKILAEKLWLPIDISVLVFFRIAFGVLMFWEVLRYMSLGRVSRYFIEPEFFFYFWGFDWVKPLAGEGMIWLFYGLGLLAICIIIGFCYRLAMSFFCLGFSYIFLLDQSIYLNHFYLICLLSFLMIFVPAHRAYSLDALLRPKIRSTIAPAWALWLLRGQMAIVYFYGGIAKINPDWLRAEPISSWLAARTYFPLLGLWFDEAWMGYLFAYGGLFFDLLIVPLLLYKHTRHGALLLAFGFHAMNGMLFNIGIFPFLAMAGTIIFLPPAYFSWPFQRSNQEKFTPHYGLLLFFAGYFAIQLLLPLRHFLYSGNVSWTEQGHTLAWHMKLRSKVGASFLYAFDPNTGDKSEIPLEDYLNANQIDQMRDNAQMLLRFAHYVAGDYAGQEIRVWSLMALNRRAPQLMIDPFVNLAAMPDDLWADDWVLPLMQDVPHERAIPTLLLSRRVDGILALVNATITPFPLDDLRLDFGGTVYLGEGSLLPASCILLYNDRRLVPASICPMASTIYLEADFADFAIYFDDSFYVNCPDLSCLLAKP